MKLQLLVNLSTLILMLLILSCAPQQDATGTLLGTIPSPEVSEITEGLDENMVLDHLGEELEQDISFEELENLNLE